MRVQLWVLCALSFSAAVGCSYQDVLDEHGSTLDRLVAGTPASKVTKAFPAAALVQTKQVDGREVEALELVHRWRRATARSQDELPPETDIPSNTPGTQGNVVQRYKTEWVTERIWFYISEDRLIRWGSPGIWPSAPELNRVLSMPVPADG